MARPPHQTTRHLTGVNPLGADMSYTDKDYPASRDRAAIGVKPFAPAGHDFPGGVKTGDVAYVLGYVVEQWHARVEPLGEGCWGHAYRPNRNSRAAVSRHARGIAVDVNAPKHPNGTPAAKTLSGAQIKTIRAILAEVQHVIRWGGDYTATPDPMHLEVNDSPAALKRVAAALRAKRRPPASTPAWYVRRLGRGDEGSDVRVARHNLHLPLKGTAADRVYDEAIVRAVRTLQNHKQLPITGVIDAATSRAIG